MCKRHLIGLNVIQDVVFIFLTNSYVEFLLVIMYQLLNVNIVRLWSLRPDLWLVHKLESL
jgi:hypothetical protein